MSRSTAAGAVPSAPARYPTDQRALLCIWIATLPLWISASLDLTRNVGLGPVSGSGMLSIAQVAIITAAALAYGVYPRRVVGRMLPWAAFVGWAGMSVFWSPFVSVNAVQNAVVYILFGVVVVLVASLVARYPEETLAAVDRGIRGIDVIGLGLGGASLALRGFPSDDSAWLVGPRSFALLGLVAISWHLAQWHHGRRGAGIRAWCWLTGIALSLSRTATAIAVVYIALALLLKSCSRPRELLRRVPLLLGGLAITGAFVAYFTPFHQRFVTGDLSIAIGQTQVNASGRMQMWEIVIGSAQRSPWIGQGLGSSQFAISEMGETIGHPHNDYLRLWHDLGLVGLGLFIIAVQGWFVGLLRSWRIAARHCPARAPAALGAMFALVGLLMAAFTDNAIVYPFVMGPLAVVTGAGLGAGISCAVILQPRSKRACAA